MLAAGELSSRAAVAADAVAVGRPVGADRDARISYHACYRLQTVDFDVAAAAGVLVDVAQRIKADFLDLAAGWAVFPARRAERSHVSPIRYPDLFSSKPALIEDPFTLPDVPGAEAETIRPTDRSSRSSSLASSIQYAAARKEADFFEDMRKRQREKWEGVRAILAALAELHSLHAEHLKA